METLIETKTSPAPKRRRRWLRRIAWGAVWLLTLYALFIVVENWRGRRAWNQYVRDMEARGESLNPMALIPPQIPDDENFAMAPLFRPLFEFEKFPGPREIPRWKNPAAKQALDSIRPHGPAGVKKPAVTGWHQGRPIEMVEWQKHYRSLPEFPKNPEPGEPARDVLLALSRYDKQLAGLREAAARPGSRFPVAYERGAAAQIPHVGVLQELAKLPQMRASAGLALGEAGQSFEDLRLMFRLMDSLAGDPVLIGSMVRNAILGMAMQPLWEGQRRHQWSASQLEQLQAQVSRLNFAAEYRRGIRSERDLVGFPFLDALRGRQEGLLPIGEDLSNQLALFYHPAQSFLPGGWFDQNKVALGRAQQRLIDSVGENPIRFHPSETARIELKQASAGPRIYDVFARLFVPMGTSIQRRFVQSQCTADLAVVALMLERHWLRHGGYPESLDRLDSDLVDSPKGIPKDCITGEPPRYRPTSDGSFVLYYVGWNGSDEGGQVVERAKGAGGADISQGDWVWPQIVQP